MEGALKVVLKWLGESMIRRFGDAMLIASVLSFCLMSEISHADTGVIEVHNIIPKTLTVLNDGKAYTGLSKKPLMMTAQLRLTLDANALGGIKGWQVWLHASLKDGPKIHFSPYKDEMRYNAPYPKTVETVALLSIPHKAIEPVLVAHCRALAGRLKEQGKTEVEIYDKDRTLSFGLAGSLNYEPVGGGNRSLSETRPFKTLGRLTVICGAAPKGMPIPD